MSSVQDRTSIPQECSSQQLFEDASEVVKLATDLAHLEDQFQDKYFEYYMNAPVSITDKGREMYALNQVKQNHQDLWVQIDTTRARMKGLTLKASIISSATRVLGIESGTPVTP
jgi:hypothetical protein